MTTFLVNGNPNDESIETSRLNKVHATFAGLNGDRH